MATRRDSRQRPRRAGQTLRARLDELHERGEAPCFFAVDELQYGQNLAALLRVADAAGMHGIVLPSSRSLPGVTQAVRRLAGPACDRVPLLREGLMSALSTLRRAGVLIVAADEHADAPFDRVDYTGATVFVLGGEDKGVTETVRRKCDHVVSLPMYGHIPSLNVAATGAVLAFERLRQARADARARAGEAGKGEA